MVYKCKEDERLDSIVLAHYGTLEVLENVLELNAKLSLSSVLKAGDEINLPVLEIKKQNSEVITLW
ncbi:phage tail protein X family protein [Campylobacter iguaniorum]|uniref:tail protein X n=1 Tax=Campylobacter iguaniorum TaxID=1244531 RepID=UPI00073A6326|nr:tail protein X [Campylobacter iguaniorum]ALV25027.1 phage tail protein X family protein [Campylobacter iguaniorum]